MPSLSSTLRFRRVVWEDDCHGRRGNRPRTDLSLISSWVIYALKCISISLTQERYLRNTFTLNLPAVQLLNSFLSDQSPLNYTLFKDYMNHHSL